MHLKQIISAVMTVVTLPPPHFFPTCPFSPSLCFSLVKHKYIEMFVFCFIQLYTGCKMMIVWMAGWLVSWVGGGGGG